MFMGTHACVCMCVWKPEVCLGCVIPWVSSTLVYFYIFIILCHLLLLLRVCEHVHMHVQARMPVWRSEVACKGWFSPFTMWIPGTKLGSSDLEASTFSGWDISLAHNFSYFLRQGLSLASRLPNRWGRPDNESQDSPCFPHPSHPAFLMWVLWRGSPGLQEKHFTY